MFLYILLRGEVYTGWPHSGHVITNFTKKRSGSKIILRLRASDALLINLNYGILLKLSFLVSAPPGQENSRMDFSCIVLGSLNKIIYISHTLIYNKHI